ncbi:MAG: lysozyme [Novosphingobium sp.]
MAAMLAIATPIVASWEGKSNTPRWDHIGKVWDVCYGETRVEMRRYTDAECTAMLRKAVGEFGERAAQCVPGLRDRPMQWAAAASLSYNIGSAAFCRSTAAKRFNSGDWAGGCEAFKAWTMAGGRYVQGLANRRYASKDPALIPEYAVCMTGLK